MINFIVGEVSLILFNFVETAGCYFVCSLLSGMFKLFVLFIVSTFGEAMDIYFFSTFVGLLESLVSYDLQSRTIHSHVFEHAHEVSLVKNILFEWINSCTQMLHQALTRQILIKKAVIQWNYLCYELLKRQICSRNA